MMSGDRALEKAKQWARRLVGLHTLAASNANRKEQVEGHATDGDDPDYQLPVERMQHYGFRSRPGAGARIVTVAPEGGVSQRIAIASEVPGAGPDDQEDGEVELYAQEGQRVIMDKDGHLTVAVADGKKITITANGATIEIGTDGSVKVDSAAGKDVTVNSGTLKVARESDPVDATANFATWVAGVQAALTAASTGAPITVPAAPTSLGLIRTGAGAGRFKG